MPIKPIVTDKEQLSKPCRETTLEEARPVIMNLMDTAHFHKKNCASLAANQIGSDLRVFVVKVRGKFIAFINPSYTPSGGSIIDTVEGCLSLPGKQSRTRRFTAILTSAPKGKRRGLILNDIAAIAFQHELDHLDGRII